MMELYKNKWQYLYLLLVTVLVFLGAFFIAPISPVSDFFSSFVLVPLVLFINSTLLDWILSKLELDNINRFLLCALYLACPLHMDAFEFPSLIQLYLGETFLMLSLTFYLKEKLNTSLIALIFATFLNFKLVGFLPLVLFSEKLTLKNKIIYGVNILVIMIYSMPEFAREFSFAGDNLKTIIFTTQNLFIPFNFSFLNYSVLITDYYASWFLGFFMVLMMATAALGFVKKFPYAKLASYSVVGLFISMFVPVKYYLSSELKYYFYMPGQVPFVFILFFLMLILLVKKYQRKTIAVLLTLFCTFWIITGMSIQSDSTNFMASWKTAMARLPENFNYKDDLKFNYVEILIDKGFSEEAEKMVAKYKLEFKKERWFSLHISIAEKKQDTALVQSIYNELNDLKIPFTPLDVSAHERKETH